MARGGDGKSGHQMNGQWGSFLTRSPMVESWVHFHLFLKVKQHHTTYTSDTSVSSLMVIKHTFLEKSGAAPRFFPGRQRFGGLLGRLHSERRLEKIGRTFGIPGKRHINRPCISFHRFFSLDFLQMPHLAKEVCFAMYPRIHLIDLFETTAECAERC